MKKLGFLIFIILFFLLTGCAVKPAEVFSNYQEPALLTGKKMIVTSQTHRKSIRIGNNFINYFSSRLRNNGVRAQRFFQNDELSLENNLALDFAKAEQADYLMVINFSKVKTITQPGAVGLTDADIEIIIIDMKTGKIIWKADAVYVPTYSFASNKVFKSLGLGLIQQLKDDSFLMP